jgi:hypothetical protein
VVMLRPVLAILLAVAATITGSGNAQERSGNNSTALAECRAILESSKRVEASLRNMLTEVQRQLDDAEKLSKAVGPDAFEDSLNLLADQEKRLSAMLRDFPPIKCPSN